MSDPKPLKQPAKAGFMGPQAILTVTKAMEEHSGARAAGRLLQAAQIFRMPAQDEPVREARVADLHRALRDEFPLAARHVLPRAGEMTADFVLDHRITTRARSLFSAAPWPIAAWLLGKLSQQNAWTFVGSGQFEIVNRMEFRVTNNPAIKDETSTAPICTYHAALFTGLFRALVHPQLTCTEISCAATGAEACSFRVHGPG